MKAVSHLCHSVMALEVCTVKNEKGNAEIILVKYLLIVPYPLRLTFPSCPGANTGATPWPSPGMKIKPWCFFCCCRSIAHFPHVVFPLAAASSGSHCFLSWTLDTLRVEFSVWFFYLLEYAVWYVRVSVQMLLFISVHLTMEPKQKRVKPWYQNWERKCVHLDQTLFYFFSLFLFFFFSY